MRLFSLSLIALFCLTISASAQGFDIASVKADPVRFIFDDGKHTVNGYIYSMLEEKTSCCGNDAIYLEVVFNSSGIVTSAKTLTGRSDCYKKSVVDIVKSVRWDAAGVSGSKTVYFEVKPIVPCSGSPGENVYKPVTFDNIAAVTNDGGDNNGGDDWGNDNAGDDGGDDVVVDEGGMDDGGMDDGGMDDGGDDNSGMDDGGDDVVVDDGGFLTGDGGDNMGDDSGNDVSDNGGDDSGSEPDDFSGDDNSNNNDVNANSWTNNNSNKMKDPKPRSTGGDGKIPPQMDMEYVSSGDRKPDESHSDSHKNFDPNKVNQPTFASNESEVAIAIKKGLRTNGVCGLAQALLELTVDPRTGNIVKTNVMKANSTKVSSLIPTILNNVKFTGQGNVRHNYVTYIQFKTDIVCGTKPSVDDLDEVPDYINLPKAQIR